MKATRIHAFIAAIALVAFGAGCSPSRSPQARAFAQGSSGGELHPTNASQTVAPDAQGAAALHGLPDFSSLVERYGDAVVNVEVTGHPRLSAGGPDVDQNDPLGDLFRHFGIQPPGAGGGGPGGDVPTMHGLGSGFIVSRDGYILTNAHVVSQADEVTVRLTDRREFPAKVIGSDQRTDVAVIKIDANNLPVVNIGDPRSLKTGQWVLAIGSPFGLSNSATAGIVSSTSREVGGASTVPFIQTDVAVNPGNSGGPLFDLDGRVVGINSMIFSQSGGYMGISFAIPIDVAMNVREQLVKTGHVVRGRIGVAAQNVDAALAKSFQLDRPRGALVSSVESGGPAEKGGVKTGDVILKVNGEPIDESGELANVISNIKPGNDAKLDIWRNGKEQQLTVQVAKLEEPQTRTANRAGGGPEESAKLGLEVRPLTREEKRSSGTRGNLVVEDAEGAAARAGVQAGDIILAVNSKEVKSVDDLRNAASKLNKGDSAALLVERQGSQIFVPVKVG